MDFKRKLKKLIKMPYYFLLSRLNREKYAKKLGVNFGKNCRFYGNIHWNTEPWIITLGNNVHITNEVDFVTHDGATLLFRDREPTLELTRPITIGDNVYIGTRSIILGGVNIGNNVIIGARSVVTKDIPDNSVAAGVPCRVIKSTEEYLEKLKRESLHLGHLKGKEKDKALREYYGM